MIPAQSIACQIVSVNDVGGVIPSKSFKLYDLHFQRPKKELLDYFIKHYGTVSPKEHKDLVERDQILWYQDRIFVLASLRTRVMQLFHDAPTVGHPGIARTLAVITQSFSWPGIRKDVIGYVNSCDSCQRVKARQQNPEGVLKPLPIPHCPWSFIGMDFINKLPLLGGFDSIMVVVDLLSKITHFIPCNETYLADQ
jgi:hypothetical protein